MFMGQFLDSIKILAPKFLREDTHMLFIIIIIIGPFRYCEVVLRKICYKRFWNWKTENIFCIVRLPWGKYGYKWVGCHYTASFP